VISCTECHRRKQKVGWSAASQTALTLTIQCDRAFPCSNCIARKKESLCHYENESARKQQLLEESASVSSDGGNRSSLGRLEADSTTQVSSLGYVKGGENSTTTLAIFKRIEGYGENPSPVVAQAPPSTADNSGLGEKYKSFIRQLPSKEHIEKLVATYFHEVNYQYYPLDEGIFRDHLQQWFDLSFSTLNEGPLGLSGDLRFLPALLFQMLALALQYQPSNYDRSLDSLKYAAGMSLDNLASDYSESGIAISSLLGKRHTALTAVQAGFLRTSYLKNCGMIPESWHSLSQTIRDAQEIGLHKKLMDRPRAALLTAEDTLENLWAEQLRRRMWMTLTGWDIHMAIILGRPTTIDSRDAATILPIDAPSPKNRRAVAPSPRTEDDPPTPLTTYIWSAKISTTLWDIYNLERDDPNQRHIPGVERIHKMIAEAALSCPPFLRVENPDTRFDSHPDCYWLPYFRRKIQTDLAFAYMALHRPYIFTKASSRTAAVSAALDILRAQRKFFSSLDEKDYKMFSLVISTFDAIVLVAAVYILHPNENRDQLDDALQHFEWGMERFKMLGGRNAMANSALGVLKAINVRLKKVLSCGKTPRYLSPASQTSARPFTHPTSSTSSSSTSPPAPTPGAYSARSGSGLQQIARSQSSAPNVYSLSASTSDFSNHSQYIQPTISNLTSPTPPPDPAWERFSGNMQISPNFDFSSMAPLQPVHDLIYNDLSTIVDAQALDPQLGDMGTSDMGVVDTSAWQFEGDFRNDSFWGLMNYYNP
jgi:hypothetical protein